MHPPRGARRLSSHGPGRAAADPLKVGEEELRLALENLRGRLVRQDTVLKMSMAEQRRLNADAARTMERLREAVELLDQRLAKGERRLAGYTGALASLWLVIQIVQILLR